MIKSINSTIKEKVKIKQHVRIEGGKVSNVKQHMALREVNPDKGLGHSKNIQTYIDTLSKIDINTELGKNIKNAYSQGINTIHDVGLDSENNNQNLKTGYNDYGSISAIDENNEDLNKEIIGWDTVKRRFIDPEYIRNVSDKVDAIEKSFNNIYNIPTERLTPFTFKFTQKTPTEINIDTNKIRSQFKELINKTGMNDNRELNDELTVRREMGTLNLLIDTLPISIYPLIESESQKGLENFLQKNLYRKFFRVFGISTIKYYNLKEVSYVNKLNSYIHDPIFNEDSEVVRNDFKKFCNEDEYLKKDKELKNTLMKLRPQQVKPFIEFVSNFGHIPTAEMMNKIIDPIVRMAKIISNNIIESRKQKTYMDIYVSKNPMELLTMSPSGNFESCQSLVNRDGNSTVSFNNANMLSAAYGNHNHDFIMFTAEKTAKGLEKRARVSLNQDNDIKKLRTFENCKIYSSNQEHKNIINEVIQNRIGKSNIIDKIDTDFFFQFKQRLSTGIFEDAISNIDEKFKKYSSDIDNAIKNNDDNKFRSGIKSMSLDWKNINDIRKDDLEKREIINKAKKIYKEDVLKSFKSGESMLYESNLHSVLGSFDENEAFNNLNTVLYIESSTQETRIRELIKEQKNKKKMISKQNTQIRLDSEYIQTLDSLVKEPIKVKQHIRNIKGKTETIKQHIRIQEVNPDKDFPELTDMIDKLSKINMKTEQGKNLYDIYTQGPNATYDGKMEDSGQNLEKAYNEFGSSITSLQPTSDIIGNFFKQDNIKYRLTNSEFIRNLSNKVNDIEKTFNDSGIKTKRLTPFTFSFEHEHDELFDLDKKQFKDSLLNIAHENGILSRNNNFIQVEDRELDSCAEHFSSNFNKNLYDSPQKAKRVISDYIYSIFSRMFNKEISTTFNLNIVPLDDKEKINDIICSYNIHKLDSETIRKMIKNKFSTDKDNYVKKQAMKMKPQYIKSFVEFIARRGYIPTLEMMDNIYGGIEKISQNIVNRGFFKHKNENKKEISEIYVSKNPFEFLTMSPSTSFESCQSLISKGDGRSTVSSMNANLINAVYGDKNNDFILFTARNNNGKLEKTTRISLNYDSRKKMFWSPENGKIYGVSSGAKKVIEDFLSNKINFIKEPELPLSQLIEKTKRDSHHDIINSFSDVLGHIGKLNEDTLNNINNNNKDNYEKNISELSKIKTTLIKNWRNPSQRDNQIKHFAEKKGERVQNLLNNSTESMLYSSELHKFISFETIDINKIESLLDYQMDNINDELEYVILNLTKKWDDRGKIEDSLNIDVNIINNRILAIDSLTRERIKVKQHMRNEKGKISSVKEHYRMQEINPDKDVKEEEIKEPNDKTKQLMDEHGQDEPPDKQGITKKEFEDALKRMYHQLKNNEYFNNYKEFIDRDPRSIGLELDSDGELHKLYFKNLPENISTKDLVIAYKNNLLPDIEKNMNVDKIEIPDKIDAKLLATLGEPESKEKLEGKQLIETWENANKRRDSKNSNIVDKARYDVFVDQMMNLDLSKRLNIKESEVTSSPDIVGGFLIDLLSQSGRSIKNERSA